jgi:predicted kinase
MQIALHQLCLVALIGASGSGKSSFARRHFLATEVVSSDACRGWISDDENDQAISAQAFDLLYHIVAQRLAAGRLTVVDATNVRPEDRKRLIEMARRFHVFAAAIVFDLPDSVCNARNAVRHDRQFGEHVVRNQNCAAPCAACSAKAFAPSRGCPRSKPSTRPRSHARACGTTVATTAARSTSSATYTAAATNWSRCCSAWATRSAVRV